ncbi:probable U3 small nucleolar RNA-associated protein 11 [Schistocerca cancellata]|uniref:probable U3 small nucleolar RNA-associated protein 11 n=1 Tax=Schistocerca cancellata TaxID=274614 RepID=UPI0021188BD5|nr:probable U3 small nucleolar RNA-associated protein 11 [Schistocerca cancellata]XP_049787616.1 probable U3 small nucleolar RNA-associated protein 11 [Schistocerca cancellata]
MSSWKKTSKANQKTHRERSQPESRAHLGILEKKKDYKERAKNYGKKKKTLKILKKRALDRNPDEFYFHMINSRVLDGEHHEVDKPDEHTPEQIKLMQTQDLRYVTTKRTMESKKIDKLQSQLHLIDVADQTENTHIFFVDTEEEAKKFDVAARLDTHPSLLGRRTNRPRLSVLKNTLLPEVDENILEKAVLQRTQAYKELSKRIQREKELAVVQQKLEIERHLQNKKEERPKKIKPGSQDSAPVYEWKFERKR